MSADRQIRIRGKQREQIDVDLLAQLVVMLGRQLAREAGTGSMPVAPNTQDADLAALLGMERQNTRDGEEIGEDAQ